MHHPVSPMNKHQSFRFTCSPRSACFNACCRDLNQVLTPYDVLVLKRFLGLSSSDFLKAYTVDGTGQGSGLPVVSLRFDDSNDLACPFVTDSGCRVYHARPASCRTYPLARGVSRQRETGRLTEHWALIREPHCLGFLNGRLQTVADWVEDQQLETHNRMNDLLLELISLKNRLRPGPLSPVARQQAYTALYDLDVFEKMHVSNGALPHASDADLLSAAMNWIKDHLFAPLPGNP
ncbi:MAG: YkgJ family cysteine cluster protein [Desulfosarcina sp.]